VVFRRGILCGLPDGSFAGVVVIVNRLMGIGVVVNVFGESEDGWRVFWLMLMKMTSGAVGLTLGG